MSEQCRQEASAPRQEAELGHLHIPYRMHAWFCERLPQPVALCVSQLLLASQDPKPMPNPVQSLDLKRREINRLIVKKAVNVYLSEKILKCWVSDLLIFEGLSKE